MSRIRSRFTFCTLSGAVVLIAAVACHSSARQPARVLHQGGDILVSGEAQPVTDSVVGDAMLAGQEVRFSGATGGDYLGAAGRQNVGGRIHGSLRAAGGEIHVTALVDRNATVAGGHVQLEQSSVIGRNAYLAGSDVQVTGTVRQALRAAGGTVVLDGVVGGDVLVNARELRVGPHARISGNLSYRVPRGHAVIDSAAQISGQVSAREARNWNFPGQVLHFAWLLGFLLVGVVLVALFPRAADSVTETLRTRPWSSLLFGVIWIILIPLIAIAIGLTLIGLPLTFLLCAAYGMLVYVSRVIPAIWLGRLILGARAGLERPGMIARFGTGGVILVILELFPGFGTLVMLVATLFGFGASILWMWARFRHRPGSAAEA
jgi:hypothetical protein